MKTLSIVLYVIGGISIVLAVFVLEEYFLLADIIGLVLLLAGFIVGKIASKNEVYDDDDYFDNEKESKQDVENDEYQYNLGLKYRDGLGVEVNYEKAFYWFLKSANQGNCLAEYEVAACYYLGDGVEVNNDKKIYWLEKSANHGYCEAQNSLGSCYYLGLGVEIDYEKAVYWYKKAAEQGSANAQLNLGNFYRYGEGVKKNIKTAIVGIKKQPNKITKKRYNT
jgi:TPR repeat protein